MNTIKTLPAEKLPEGIKDFVSFLYSFACFGASTLLYKGPAIISHITGGRSHFQNSFDILNKNGTSSNKLTTSETTINPEISGKNIPADFQPLTGVKKCTRLSLFYKQIPFFVFR
jgi:hypothetical protein